MSTFLQESDNRTIAAMGLIGLGLLLLLGLGVLWPLFILLPGLALMAIVNNGEKATAALAVPGMLVAGTGGLLLFQAVTGYWESWAFAWTLYGVFLGTGMMIMGEKLDTPDLVMVGRWFTIIGGVSFFGFGALFMLATSSLFRIVLVLACFVIAARLLTKKDPSSKHKEKPMPDNTVEKNTVRVEVKQVHEEDII
jgi:hypothetical protein